MTDVTLRIKNLSFALEALSRINNEGSPDLYDSIATCLKKEIEELIKEQNPLEKAPARPANPSTDDDFPF